MFVVCNCREMCAVRVQCRVNISIVCVRMFVCIPVVAGEIHIFRQLCGSVRVDTVVCMPTCTFVCMSVCLYVPTYVCVHVCVHASPYVCMCVYLGGVGIRRQSLCVHVQRKPCTHAQNACEGMYTCTQGCAHLCDGGMDTHTHAGSYVVVLMYANCVYVCIFIYGRKKCTPLVRW